MPGRHTGPHIRGFRSHPLVAFETGAFVGHPSFLRCGMIGVRARGLARMALPVENSAPVPRTRSRQLRVPRLLKVASDTPHQPDRVEASLGSGELFAP